ncbi:MAG: hypothetical protein AB1491_03140 [Thermodesulfobacteriota bacterium]
MPQCPHCKTAYELGQQYCQVCESYLAHPEEGDTFCPQCGIRVGPRQEVCHKCDAALAPAGAPPPPEAEPAPTPPPPRPEPPPAAPPPQKLPTWVTGLLAGAGVIIIILLIMLVSRGTAPPPPPAPPPAVEGKPLPPAPPVAVAPERPAPEASLPDQLAKVLNNLKEAQLKKDIYLYMSCYSYVYPELDQKRSDALKYWEHYNFNNLVFSLAGIQPLGPDNALAEVTWEMQVQNRRTQALDNLTQVFKVAFAKELGQWRIRSLEEVAKER